MRCVSAWARRAIDKAAFWLSSAMTPPKSTTRATIRRRRARRSGERRGVRAPRSGEAREGRLILSEGQINAIVDRVVRQLSPELREVPQAPLAQPAGPVADEPIHPRAAPARASTSGALHGVFDDLEAAIRAAVQSFERWSLVPLEGRGRAIEAMREATRKYAEEL